MKLHLPSGLRKALLACLAAVALPTATIPTTLASASGIAAVFLATSQRAVADEQGDLTLGTKAVEGSETVSGKLVVSDDDAGSTGIQIQDGESLTVKGALEGPNGKNLRISSGENNKASSGQVILEQGGSMDGWLNVFDGVTVVIGNQATDLSVAGLGGNCFSFSAAEGQPATLKVTEGNPDTSRGTYVARGQKDRHSKIGANVTLELASNTTQLVSGMDFEANSHAKLGDGSTLKFINGAWGDNVSSFAGELEGSGTIEVTPGGGLTQNQGNHTDSDTGKHRLEWKGSSTTFAGTLTVGANGIFDMSTDFSANQVTLAENSTVQLTAGTLKASSRVNLSGGEATLKLTVGENFTAGFLDFGGLSGEGTLKVVLTDWDTWNGTQDSLQLFAGDSSWLNSVLSKFSFYDGEGSELEEVQLGTDGRLTWGSSVEPGADPFTGVVYDPVPLENSPQEVSGNKTIDVSTEPLAAFTFSDASNTELKLNGTGGDDTECTMTNAVDLSGLKSLYLTGKGFFTENGSFGGTGPKTIYVKGAQFYINGWGATTSPLKIDSEFVIGESTTNHGSGWVVGINNAAIAVGRCLETTGGLTLKEDAAIGFLSDAKTGQGEGSTGGSVVTFGGAVSGSGHTLTLTSAISSNAGGNLRSLVLNGGGTLGSINSSTDDRLIVELGGGQGKGLTLENGGTISGTLKLDGEANLKVGSGTLTVGTVDASAGNASLTLTMAGDGGNLDFTSLNLGEEGAKLSITLTGYDTWNADGSKKEYQLFNSSSFAALWQTLNTQDKTWSDFFDIEVDGKTLSTLSMDQQGKLTWGDVESDPIVHNTSEWAAFVGNSNQNAQGKTVIIDQNAELYFPENREADSVVEANLVLKTDLTINNGYSATDHAYVFNGDFSSDPSAESTDFKMVEGTIHHQHWKFTGDMSGWNGNFLITAGGGNDVLEFSGENFRSFTGNITLTTSGSSTLLVDGVELKAGQINADKLEIRGESTLSGTSVNITGETTVSEGASLTLGNNTQATLTTLTLGGDATLGVSGSAQLNIGSIANNEHTLTINLSDLNWADDSYQLFTGANTDFTSLVESGALVFSGYDGVELNADGTLTLKGDVPPGPSGDQDYIWTGSGATVTLGDTIADGVEGWSEYGAVDSTKSVALQGSAAGGVTVTVDGGEDATVAMKSLSVGDGKGTTTYTFAAAGETAQMLSVSEGITVYGSATFGANVNVMANLSVSSGASVTFVGAGRKIFTGGITLGKDATMVLKASGDEYNQANPAAGDSGWTAAVIDGADAALELQLGTAQAHWGDWFGNLFASQGTKSTLGTIRLVGTQLTMDSNLGDRLTNVSAIEIQKGSSLSYYQTGGSTDLLSGTGHTLRLAGSGQEGAGALQINTSAAVTVAWDIVLDGDATVSNTAATTLTGEMNGANHTLTKKGAGDLALGAGFSTAAGSSGTIAMTEGTLRLGYTDAGALAGYTLQLAGGTTVDNTVSGQLSLSRLQVNGGEATLRLAVGEDFTGGLLNLGGVSFEGDGSLKVVLTDWDAGWLDELEGLQLFNSDNVNWLNDELISKFSFYGVSGEEETDLSGQVTLGTDGKLVWNQGEVADYTWITSDENNTWTAAGDGAPQNWNNGEGAGTWSNNGRTRALFNDENGETVTVSGGVRAYDVEVQKGTWEFVVEGKDNSLTVANGITVSGGSVLALSGGGKVSTANVDLTGGSLELKQTDLSFSGSIKGGAGTLRGDGYALYSGGGEMSWGDYTGKYGERVLGEGVGYGAAAGKDGLTISDAVTLDKSFKAAEGASVTFGGDVTLGEGASLVVGDDAQIALNGTLGGAVQVTHEGTQGGQGTVTTSVGYIETFGGDETMNFGEGVRLAVNGPTNAGEWGWVKNVNVLGELELTGNEVVLQGTNEIGKLVAQNAAGKVTLDSANVSTTLKGDTQISAILDVRAGELVIGGEGDTQTTLTLMGGLTGGGGTIKGANLTFEGSGAAQTWGGELQLNGALTVNGGDQTLSGANVTVGSLAVNGGTLTWTGGTMTVNGNVSTSGGTFRISYTANESKLAWGNATIDGSLTLTVDGFTDEAIGDNGYALFTDGGWKAGWEDQIIVVGKTAEGSDLEIDNAGRLVKLAVGEALYWPGNGTDTELAWGDGGGNEWATAGDAAPSVGWTKNSPVYLGATGNATVTLQDSSIIANSITFSAATGADSEGYTFTSDQESSALVVKNNLTNVDQKEVAVKATFDEKVNVHVQGDFLGKGAATSYTFKKKLAVDGLMQIWGGTTVELDEGGEVGTLDVSWNSNGTIKLGGDLVVGNWNFRDAGAHGGHHSTFEKTGDAEEVFLNVHSVTEWRGGSELSMTGNGGTLSLGEGVGIKSSTGVLTFGGTTAFAVGGSYAAVDGGSMVFNVDATAGMNVEVGSGSSITVNGGKTLSAGGAVEMVDGTSITLGAGAKLTSGGALTLGSGTGTLNITVGDNFEDAILSFGGFSGDGSLKIVLSNWSDWNEAHNSLQLFAGDSSWLNDVLSKFSFYDGEGAELEEVQLGVDGRLTWGGASPEPPPPGADPFTRLVYDDDSLPNEAGQVVDGNKTVEVASGAVAALTLTSGNLQIKGTGTASTSEYALAGLKDADWSNLDSVYLSGNGFFTDGGCFSVHHPKTIYIKGAQLYISAWSIAAGNDPAFDELDLSDAKLVIGPSTGGHTQIGTGDAGAAICVGRPTKVDTLEIREGDARINYFLSTYTGDMSFTVNSVDAADYGLTLGGNNEKFVFEVTQGGTLKSLTSAGTNVVSLAAGGALELKEGASIGGTLRLGSGANLTVGSGTLTVGTVDASAGNASLTLTMAGDGGNLSITSLNLGEEGAKLSITLTGYDTWNADGSKKAYQLFNTDTFTSLWGALGGDGSKEWSEFFDIQVDGKTLQNLALNEQGQLTWGDVESDLIVHNTSDWSNFVGDPTQNAKGKTVIIDQNAELYFPDNKDADSVVEANLVLKTDLTINNGYSGREYAYVFNGDFSSDPSAESTDFKMVEGTIHHQHWKFTGDMSGWNGNFLITAGGGNDVLEFSGENFRSFTGNITLTTSGSSTLLVDGVELKAGQINADKLEIRGESTLSGTSVNITGETTVSEGASLTLGNNTQATLTTLTLGGDATLGVSGSAQLNIGSIANNEHTLTINLSDLNWADDSYQLFTGANTDFTSLVESGALVFSGYDGVELNADGTLTLKGDVPPGPSGDQDYIWTGSGATVTLGDTIADGVEGWSEYGAVDSTKSVALQGSAAGGVTVTVDGGEDATVAMKSLSVGDGKGTTTYTFAAAGETAQTLNVSEGITVYDSTTFGANVNVTAGGTLTVVKGATLTMDAESSFAGGIELGGNLTLNKKISVGDEGTIKFVGGTLTYGAEFEGADLSKKVDDKGSTDVVKVSVGKEAVGVTWGVVGESLADNGGLRLALDKGVEKSGDGEFTLAWTDSGTEEHGGDLTVNEGSLTLEVEGSTVLTGAVTGEGTLKIAGGQVTLSNEENTVKSIEVGSGATLKAGNSKALGGEGATLTLSGGTLAAEGALTVVGDVTVGADSKVAGDLTLSGKISGEGTTLTVASETKATISGSLADFKDGTLGTQGGASWTLSGDALKGEVTTNVSGAGSIIFDSASNVTYSGEVRDGGTTLVNGGAGQLTITTSGNVSPDAKLQTQEGKGAIVLGAKDKSVTWAGRTVTGNGELTLSNVTLTNGMNLGGSTLNIVTTGDVSLGGMAMDGVKLGTVTVNAGDTVSALNGTMTASETDQFTLFIGENNVEAVSKARVGGEEGENSALFEGTEDSELTLKVEKADALRLDFTNSALIDTLEAIREAQTDFLLHIVENGTLEMDKDLWSGIKGRTKNADNFELLKNLGLEIVGVEGGDIRLEATKELNVYLVTSEEGWTSDSVAVGGENGDPAYKSGYGVLDYRDVTALDKGKTLTLTLTGEATRDNGATQAEVDAGGAIVHNLVGLEGSALEVKNGDGGDKKLVLDNTSPAKSSDGVLPEDFDDRVGQNTTFQGSIYAERGVDVEKMGAGTLTVGGNYKLDEGTTTLTGGALVLNGSKNEMDGLAFSYDEEPASGKRGLELNGGMTTIGSISEEGSVTDGNKVTLNSDVRLTLTGESTLESTVIGGDGSGTVTLAQNGTGDNATGAKLTLDNGAKLSGVGVNLGGDKTVLDIGTVGADVTQLNGSGALRSNGSKLAVGGGTFSGTLGMTPGGENFDENTLEVKDGASFTLDNAKSVDGAAWDVNLGDGASLTVDVSNKKPVGNGGDQLTLGEIDLGGSDSSLTINYGTNTFDSELVTGTITEGDGKLCLQSDGKVVDGTVRTGFSINFGVGPKQDDLQKWVNEHVLFTGELTNFLANLKASVDSDGVITVTITKENQNRFEQTLPNMSKNAQAGATMVWDSLRDKSTDELFLNALLNQSDYAKMAYALIDLNDKDDKAGLEKALAAVAGSSTSVLAPAMAEDMHRQLTAIRNRTTTMGAEQHFDNYDVFPLVHAWLNAEGAYRKLDADGFAPGYTLNSWGGTVGADMDVSPRTTVGLALTAMYGDLKTDAADSGKGDMDTAYVTGFVKRASGAWIHTLVLSAGLADVNLKRTVTVGSGASYTTKGDTDGYALGALYEVGYTKLLNKAGTLAIQPVANVEVRHVGINGYTEKNSDAGLTVDDMDYTVVTLGAGARMQAVVGENAWNRYSVLEGRLLVKGDLGDRSGAVNNAMFGKKGEVESAEVGAIGIEAGVGLTIPLGSQMGSLFIDGSVELRENQTSFDATLGYRISF